MKTARELTNMELVQVNGGTSQECFELFWALGANGYGAFIKANKDRGDIYDLEGMEDLLASRGYKGKMYVDDENMNIFTGPEGFPYGNDYIVYLIESGQF